MKRFLWLYLLWVPFQLAAQYPKIGDCFYQKSSGLNYCFAADSSTYDQVLGDSYRILLISNREEGSEVARHYLQVNLAADFGYQFVKDYMEVHKLLIIQGAQAFYLYDTDSGTLSDYIKPNHEDCAFSDNQGTYISDLKILFRESLLRLEVKECGTRFFDIRDIEHILEVRPAPEMDTETH